MFSLHNMQQQHAVNFIHLLFVVWHTMYWLNSRKIWQSWINVHSSIKLGFGWTCDSDCLSIFTIKQISGIKKNLRLTTEMTWAVLNIMFCILITAYRSTSMWQNHERLHNNLQLSSTQATIIIYLYIMSSLNKITWCNQAGAMQGKNTKPAKYSHIQFSKDTQRIF